MRTKTRGSTQLFMVLAVGLSLAFVASACGGDDVGPTEEVGKTGPVVGQESGAESGSELGASIAPALRGDRCTPWLCGSPGGLGGGMGPGPAPGCAYCSSCDYNPSCFGQIQCLDLRYFTFRRCR